MAKELDEEDERINQPKTFEEHLDELYEFYGPDLTRVDAPDMILSGQNKYTPGDLSYDALYYLNHLCMHRIKEVANMGDNMGARILTDDKVNHFMKWLIPQSVEFQVMCIRTLMTTYRHQHIDIAIQKHGKELLKSLELVIGNNLAESS